MISGFDKAILGMELEEEKEITLSPAEAYGEAKTEMRKAIPRGHLPKDKEPQIGMILGVKLPDGQQFPAQIVAVADKEVILDFNHPLAGKILKFKLKVVGIE